VQDLGIPAILTMAPLVGLILMLPLQITALTLRGTILVPPRKAVFLSKFCFDFGKNASVAPGFFNLKLHDVSPKIGTFEIALFDDQSGSYPNEDALWSWKCGSDHLNNSAKLQIAFDASENYWKLGKAPTVAEQINEQIRPRWWYVAIIDCAGFERTVKYDLHMTNPRQGWQQEFSMDQCGLVTLSFFLLVFIALSLSQFRAICLHSETAETSHPFRLILALSLFFAVFSSLAMVVDSSLFSHHGESNVALHLTAKLFKVCSKSALVSMLLLMSQGICISQPLHNFELRRVLRFVVPFSSACFSLEVWGEYAQSRTYTTGFVYCTWLGSLLILADVILLLVFSKNLCSAHRNELDNDKKRFYKSWGIMYSSAFIVLPGVSMLSMVVAPWVRVQATFIFTNCAHAAILAFLIGGTWPEKAHTFFCIDESQLIEAIGIKCDLLSQSRADSSPRLRARTPKAPGNDAESSFGMEANDDSV
jgi:hypothetical protein